MLRDEDKELKQRKFMGKYELRQEYVFKKKNPRSEWRKEGGGGLLAFRRRWERNDKTEGKGGGRVGGERGEVKVRGDEETEGADKKRDVAEDKHYL